MNRFNKYNNSNIFLPFGGKGSFKNAEIPYSQMDELINYINQNSDKYNANIQYSTLKYYFSSISNSSIDLNTYTGEFQKYYIILIVILINHIHILLVIIHQDHMQKEFYCIFNIFQRNNK